MNRNSLFSKHQPVKKAQLTRPPASIQEKKRILIVCEGKKTEPIYLRDAAEFFKLTTTVNIKPTESDVTISGECGSAPKSVAEHGIKIFNSENGAYDRIYFVFDRDSHPTYDDALKIIEGFATRRGVKGKVEVEAITSNPCFELWYLLHFSGSTKSYVKTNDKSPCEALLGDLRQYPPFQAYGKGEKGYFKILQDLRPQAQKNAKSIHKQSIANGDRPHHGNPVTRVDLLLDGLERVSSHNQEVEGKKRNLNSASVQALD